MAKGRRTVRGYTDIGSIAIPPLPDHIVLTDRSTATLYHLTNDGATVTLSATLPTGPGVQTFTANNEPLVGGDVLIRIYVNNAVLTYELVDNLAHASVHVERIFARKIDNSTSLFEVIQGDGFVAGVSSLTFQTVSP